MKILSITDMDSTGSGYRNICAPLFLGLSQLGYDIKVCGLMYTGNEHNFPFSIIPTTNIQEAVGMASNLVYLWQPDIILVAMDLPLQAQIFSELSQLLPRTPIEVQNGLTTPRKYIAITPLENGPLCMSWAAPLFNMDAVFFISELGKQEALKVGVHKAEHLIVGVDTESWHPATPEEKKKLRDGLGIPQDAFVVLTVADNQERKNLWAGMKAVSLLKKEITKPIRYILVTRENSPYGWKLRDLAVTLDLNQEYIPFERGIPQKDLWGLYAIADVYLQPSKAEGLGLPVMDAMACKIPVTATDTGALHELLEDDRGFLVESEHTIVDVWGNSLRHFINIEKTKNYLKDIIIWGEEGNPFVPDKAYEYVINRRWEIPVNQIDSKIKELCDGQTKN